jgi:hypothetical protein
MQQMPQVTLQQQRQHQLPCLSIQRRAPMQDQPQKQSMQSLQMQTPSQLTQHWQQQPAAVLSRAPPLQIPCLGSLSTQRPEQGQSQPLKWMQWRQMLQHQRRSQPTTQVRRQRLQTMQGQLLQWMRCQRLQLAQRQGQRASQPSQQMQCKTLQMLQSQSQLPRRMRHQRLRTVQRQGQSQPQQMCRRL